MYIYIYIYTYKYIYIYIYIFVCVFVCAGGHLARIVRYLDYLTSGCVHVKKSLPIFTYGCTFTCKYKYDSVLQLIYIGVYFVWMVQYLEQS